MLGYVQIYKPDLKVREYNLYCGYYCGICKYIGRHFGQIPRLTLSYDAAFLALLLASVSDAPDEPVEEHCIGHHIKKKTIVRNPAVEYAGDVMLILAYHKLADDLADESSRKDRAQARAGLVAMKRHYRKLSKRYPELCKTIELHLSRLSWLEEDGCRKLDRVSDEFAKIMEAIFAGGADALYSNSTEKLHETFTRIGYHLGKWIYLIDAADDIESNLKDGAYNPLFAGGAEGLTAEQVLHDQHDKLEFNLYQYLAVLGEEISSLDIKKNKGIIDNIIYFGLNRKTEEIINESI